MAASSSRSGYHQDYIARIRYSNALPPPPNPPKLLDIPGTGLASGQYTSAAYASRLAREQPLNIEADGELGMPIDLIGLPGVFDGDETVLYGLDNPPPPHPHDRALLRPLSMLGKPTSVTSGVSFLRRTEYISSDQGRSRLEGTTPRDLARLKNEARKRKRDDLNRDNDPVHMLRSIYKGFDTAYPEDAYTGPDSESNVRGAEVTAEDRAAWDKPRHPTNPDLTPIDTYPLLPDPEGFPDSGNYFVIKFMTNPSAASDSYDQRLDVAVFRPLDPPPEAVAQLEARRKAYEEDPTGQPPGGVPFDYEFFIPEADGETAAVKGMFDVNDPRKHDEAFYDNENPDTHRRFFRYKRVREYETYQQVGDAEHQYDDSVALALHDPSDAEIAKNGQGHSRLQKAAYFYPIVQRTVVRPRRKTHGGMGPPRPMGDESAKVDYMDVAIVEPDGFDQARIDANRARFDGPTAERAAE